MATAPRLSFARRYPDDPALAQLVEAFERGDYGAVREGAEKLAKETERDDVRAAALDLRKRLDPHPFGVMLLAGTFGLLLFLVVWFYLHPVHR